jgi:hypothetical protein
VNPRGFLSLIISFLLTVAPAIGVAASMNWSAVAVVGLIVAVFGTFGVWVAPSLPDQQYVKPAIAFALAGALALQQIIGSGGFTHITVAQVVMVVAAAFAAVGITVFPNQPASRRSVSATG